jgi:exonuclease III
MFNIGSWNIRGLNGHLKQKTVLDWTTKNNLDIYGLLETKIAAANMPAVESNLAPHPWKYISNGWLEPHQTQPYLHPPIPSMADL